MSMFLIVVGKGTSENGTTRVIICEIRNKLHGTYCHDKPSQLSHRAPLDQQLFVTTREAGVETDSVLKLLPAQNNDKKDSSLN